MLCESAGKITEKIESFWELKMESALRIVSFIDSCRCIGACGLAPVMLINDDVYGKITEDDVEGILAKYE